MLGRSPNKKKRILVSGAGGFIGSHLARHLLNKGYYVRAVDIKFDPWITQPFCSEAWTRDLRDPDYCVGATKGIDEVYHLAANMGGIGFITEVSAEVMRDNARLNINMAEACRINPVARMVFTSSACVYPNYLQDVPDVKGLPESCVYPADPNEAYGWEKLFAEELMRSYVDDFGLSIGIARLHNVYGPEGTYTGGREKAPAALCRKIAEADDPDCIEIWGDGTATRSFCYVDDCVRGLVELMRSNECTPINIGSDRLVSIDELADILIKISGKHIAKVHNTTKPVGVMGRNADIVRALALLGWEPTTSLEAGLKKTYNWVKKQIKRERSLGQ